jgi:hypothetical protein
VSTDSLVIDQPTETGDLEFSPVASLCSDSGWPCTERAGGCSVKLEVDRSVPPILAFIERLEGGQISAWVDLTSSPLEVEESSAAPVPALVETCRLAVSTLLMSVSRKVRCLRFVVRDTPVGWSAGFEGRLPANADATQLTDLLSSLWVACSLCGPEAQSLLTQPVLAELYLARGWSPGRLDAATIAESESSSSDSPG